MIVKDKPADSHLKMNGEEAFLIATNIHNEWEAEVHNCEIKWTSLLVYPCCFPVVWRLPALNQTSCCVLPLKQQQWPFYYFSGCWKIPPFSERLFFFPFQLWKRAAGSNNTTCTDVRHSVAFWFERGKQQQTIRKKKTTHKCHHRNF